MMNAMILALLAGTTTTAQPSIPQAFHGDWALEGRECSIGPSDSGNMRIDAHRVQHFEIRGTVTNAEPLDPQTLRLTLRNDTGAAKSGSTNMLVLSNDGNRLTIGEMSDISRYKRCKK